MYYITDRTQFAGTGAEQRSRLLQTIRKTAAAGVDFIQLREKDLCIHDLESLAREVLHLIRAEGPSRLLINHRTDVALAAGADGVHLTGADILSSDAHALAAKSHPAGQFLVAASCHSAQEVRLAEAHGANFAVLSPIFEKMNAVTTGIGLEELHQSACKDKEPDPRVEACGTCGSFPVLALGGVNMERASLCAASGAAGVAGIRIFQQCPDMPALVRSIHAL
jgi:thiamine-phosphate pyrophosphorylase